MRAKICGITNQNDAIFSLQNGAWALGFNFYAKSPRYIEQHLAKEIINRLSASVVKVGLFIDESYDFIANSVDELGLDLVQVYNQLDAPHSFKEKTILALQANSMNELPKAHILQSYGYILLDAPKTQNGLKGGTGRFANWDLANRLAKDYRLILAGGLNPENVQIAINKVNPYAVDVASGVESSTAIKNHQRIKQFLGECKHDR